MNIQAQITNNKTNENIDLSANNTDDLYTNLNTFFNAHPDEFYTLKIESKNGFFSYFSDEIDAHLFDALAEDSNSLRMLLRM